MKTKNVRIIIFLLLCSNTACAASPKIVEETLVPEPIVTSPTSTPTILPTAIPTLQPTAQNENISFVEPEIKRLWAVDASSNLISSEPEMAIGEPDADGCDDSFHSWHELYPQEDRLEYFLNLTYPYALKATEINIEITGNPQGTMRVEILNSSLGIGKEVYFGEIHAAEKCPFTMTIPLDGNTNVDTVVLTLTDQKQNIEIDAVGLAGTLENYIDLPVFWRIPIPADDLSDAESQFPGGIAADSQNTLFLANGQNGLYRYDVEGNLLKSYSVPVGSNLTDVAVNDLEKFVVTDNTNQRFITLLFDGTQIATGEDFSWNYPKEAAINPIDGNVYFLDETEEISRVRVYSPDTAKWIRDIDLFPKGIDGYKGLAFDKDSILYTIDQYESVVLKIDTTSGIVIDAVGDQPLANTSISDLAIDDAGKIYVLLRTSPDDSAVIILDPLGNLIHKFGALNYDGSEWGEGTFQSPVSIAVTRDGRFVFICENGFLTTYQIEKE